MGDLPHGANILWGNCITWGKCPWGQMWIRPTLYSCPTNLPHVVSYNVGQVCGANVDTPKIEVEIIRKINIDTIFSLVSIFMSSKITIKTPINIHFWVLFYYYVGSLM